MEYNRLVIIGNGFDRACGLESSYKEFILYILKEGYLKFFEDGIYSGPIFSLEYFNEFQSPLQNVTDEIKSENDIQKLINFRKRIIKLEFKTTFLEELISSPRNNWVDIESFYFRKICNVWENQKININESNFNSSLAASHNESLNILSDELRKYLVHAESKIGDLTSVRHSMFTDQLYEKLPGKDYFYLNRNEPKGNPESVMFLNFNYTGLASEALQKKEWNTLHIHGHIKDNSKELIFGYGDDTNGTYKQMERFEYNDFLEKIKSFQYGRDSNYHHFLNFLEEKEFEVFIVGHSCGLSDKTLLKTVFEHQNCYAIKALHYNGAEDHFYKRMAIARHFDDKISMRRKVLPYDEHYEMVQFKR